jgi:hypothetical protein
MSTSILHSTHKKGAAKSPRSPFACSTLQCCCYTCSLIRFLLSTLASPALGVLLNQVRAAHARWAYGDLVTRCKPFLNGLHPHVVILVACLLASSHVTSLSLWPPPPHACDEEEPGANARTRTGMP